MLATVIAAIRDAYDKLHLILLYRFSSDNL